MVLRLVARSDEFAIEGLPVGDRFFQPDFVAMKNDRALRSLARRRGDGRIDRLGRELRARRGLLRVRRHHRWAEQRELRQRGAAAGDEPFGVDARRLRSGREQRGVGRVVSEPTTGPAN